MKNNSKKRKQKNIIKILISGIVVLTTSFYISANASVMGLQWIIHDSSSNNTVTLVDDANQRINYQDIPDDVTTCSYIRHFGIYDDEWHFTGDAGDDGKVESTAEDIAFDSAAGAEGWGGFRLVYYKVGTLPAFGFSYYYGIVIMDSASGGSLAHEVGHWCGIHSHNTEGKTHRIMIQGYTDKNTLNATEAAYFDSGWSDSWM